MASRAPAYGATPLDVLLASVPSLPRAILARLTARMIERLDEMDGGTDGKYEQPFRYQKEMGQRFWQSQGKSRPG